MKTVGIVSEYNPFHTGHKYHIEQAREQLSADAVVAVMSGSFVQRGEPAVFSKHERARAALQSGVDLVIELPVYFSLKSAEGFCTGAVEILNALGVVDFLSFGSECGNIDKLYPISRALANETGEYKSELNSALAAGLSFAAARERAVRKTVTGAEEIIKEPNNILGIEYLKALIKTKSTITPHTVCRAGAGYHSTAPEGGFASATALREMIKGGNDVGQYMPFETDESPLFFEDLEKLILYSLLTFPEIKKVPDTGDGLYERLVSARASSLSELLSKVKTRRLAMARIKRVLMNILIGNTLPYDLHPSYIRVLGTNERGAALIRRIKKHATLPVITKPSRYKLDDPLWALECRASDVRSIALGQAPGQNLKLSPVVLKTN